VCVPAGGLWQMSRALQKIGNYLLVLRVIRMCVRLCVLCLCVMHLEMVRFRVPRLRIAGMGSSCRFKKLQCFIVVRPILG
jgi:hypothetical protein